MKKQILSMFISVALSLTIFSVVIQADVSGNGWIFSNGTLTITVADGLTYCLEEKGSSFDWDDVIKMVIGANVSTIGRADVFYDCVNLISIDVDPANTTYSSIDGVLLYNEDKGLLIYPIGRQGAYTIPNSVIRIYSNAFRNCINLTSVKIPQGVTSIGGAFLGCVKLVSVTIPNSVTSIGGYTFFDCTSLTKITIPESVTHIGREAFGSCTSLKSVMFNSETPPNFGVDDLFGRNVFYDCPNLTTIYVPIGAKAAYEAEPQLSGYNIVEQSIIPGRIIDIDTPPTIFDALEILKHLVGMDSLATGNPAALITPEAQQSSVPTIFDALEILKYLVGMDSLC